MYQYKMQPNHTIKLDVSLGLAQFLDNGVLSDVTFVVGAQYFKAHKIILVAASKYFYSMFFGWQSQPEMPGIFGPLTRNNNNISLANVQPGIFKSYLDLIYGKELLFPNWLEAFELFKYLDYTATYWPTKDNDVVNAVDIPVNDFIEYIDQLSQLYNGEIPVNVAANSINQLKKVIDLSPLGDDYIQALYETNDTYHGSVDSDGQFLIQNKLNEYVRDYRGYRIHRGKVCNTMERQKLIDILWSLGIPPPNVNSLGMTKEDIITSTFRGHKFSDINTFKTWNLYKLSYYYSWMSDPVPRESLCYIIKNKMLELGIIEQ